MQKLSMVKNWKRPQKYEVPFQTPIYLMLTWRTVLRWCTFNLDVNFAVVKWCNNHHKHDNFLFVLVLFQTKTYIYFKIDTQRNDSPSNKINSEELEVKKNIYQLCIQNISVNCKKKKT